MAAPILKALARIGPANLVTTVRAVLVAVLAAMIFGTVDAAAGWTIVGVGSIAAALDGVDGWLARRTKTESAFGARYDMEVDALLIVVLAILAWTGGKAGAWVILSGLMRYLFVMAAWVALWMKNPLPPSFRRKLVCVVQIVALLIALAPIVRQPVSEWVAVGGLAILAWSFWKDVAWLHRREQMA